MGKPIIFVSHITEEKELALNLKHFIENKFPNIVEVFVSSDENSIQLGQEWLDNITNGLKTCCIELILCSPVSIKRPWINFEAGACWVREDCTVIPVCHSNMKPEELPPPFNLLQGMTLNNQIKMRELIKVIARRISCNVPSLIGNEFIAKVRKFEEKYTYWNSINDDFIRFFKILASDGSIKIDDTNRKFTSSRIEIEAFLKLFLNKKTQVINIPIQNFDDQLFNRMNSKEIFHSEKFGTGSFSNGFFQSLILYKMPKFNEVVTSPNFIYNISEVINTR